jgi:hypothetical protein
MFRLCARVTVFLRAGSSGSSNNCCWYNVLYYLQAQFGLTILLPDLHNMGAYLSLRIAAAPRKHKLFCNKAIGMLILRISF